MKKFLLALLCLVGIVSCTRLDIAVSWADTYIVSQVDDYFDITSTQSKDLKASLKKDIAKVRTEQFMIWAAELRRFEKDLSEDRLDEQTFHDYFVKTLETSKKIQPYFSDTAVKFISSASPAQLEHFERTLRKKNIENEKKIQDGKKARYETRKKYLRWVDMWVDSLTKDQEQLLNQHLTDVPFPALAQIKNRNYTLEKFHEARKSPEGLKNFVRNYYNNKYQYADPEYRQALQNYQTELEKFMFSLIKSMNDKQKKHLSENLTEKASSLERLAAKE